MQKPTSETLPGTLQRLQRALQQATSSATLGAWARPMLRLQAPKEGVELRGYSYRRKSLRAALPRTVATREPLVSCQKPEEFAGLGEQVPSSHGRENAPFREFAPISCASGLITTCEMLKRFSAVCVLLIALLAGTATAATPEPTLRLRGGGIMSTMADKLGWKRTKVGPDELGCGPLPQVKPKDRHTQEGAKMKKKHDGDGYTRSHSFVIPDVAGQR